MDTLVDLTHDWWLYDDGQDVLLRGPGNLAIALRPFDPALLTHMDGLPHARSGTRRQLCWRYRLAPLGDDAHEEYWLQLVTTWDSTAADDVPTHQLHLGTAVVWQLPDEVGQRLHGWLLLAEQLRPAPGAPREPPTPHTPTA
jgi:hypothetical protein